MPRNYNELEEKIGYKFSDAKNLITALTHSSYANEMRAKKKYAECNERLEFLGDSVLSIIVSEYLFEQYARRPEGELTKLRAALVQSSALASYANQIELGEYLYLGVGEEKNDGRNRQSNLENAFEALLAAIYIDSRGEGKPIVKKFLMPFIIAEIEKIDNTGLHRDYKTELQQLIQQAEGDYLEYATVDETGPDHKKTFTVEARLNSNVIGKGMGKTKREAEQNAARGALELFGKE